MLSLGSNDVFCQWRSHRKERFGVWLEEQQGKTGWVTAVATCISQMLLGSGRLKTDGQRTSPPGWIVALTSGEPTRLGVPSYQGLLLGGDLHFGHLPGPILRLQWPFPPT